MKTKFNRIGKTIVEIDTDKRQVFDSINLAKKKSFKIQKTNGGLGTGYLIKS